MKVVHDSSLLAVKENRGIVNVFSGVLAQPEQQHGMLESYEIGTRQYYQYVSHRILRTPSNNKAPVRHKKLLAQ